MLINWLSIISIDHDRYDWWVSFRPRIDCVDELAVDRCWSCGQNTIDTIDGWSSDQELIVSINCLLVMSISHDRYDRLVLFTQCDSPLNVLEHLISSTVRHYVFTCGFVTTGKYTSLPLIIHFNTAALKTIRYLRETVAFIWFRDSILRGTRLSSNIVLYWIYRSLFDSDWKFNLQSIHNKQDYDRYI